MRLFLYLGLFWSTIAASYAQTANTLLLGTIQDHQGETLVLEINKDYLNNTIVQYVASLEGEGKFGFAFTLEFPQLVVLRLGTNAVELYLEPNDTLKINAFANTFPEHIHFSDKSAANNRLWLAFNENFPRSENIFEYRHYKKHIYYYTVHETLDETMRATNAADFELYLDQDLENRQRLIDTYTKEYKDAISKDFLTFLSGETYYWNYYQRLAYGHIYRYRHQIPNTFFDFVPTIQWQDKAIGHPIYRDCVMAYCNYQCEQKRPKADSLYQTQFYYAKQELSDITSLLAQAYTIEKGLANIETTSLMPIYEQFIEENPYLELDHLVVDALQQANAFAAGTPAPNFSLKNKQEEWVSLRDFQGKVIYLGFWASWCKPCIQKMEQMKSMGKELSEQGIIFIHISLDKKTEQWKHSIEKNQFGGIHLLSNAAILEDYEVLSVPRFFVINKHGNFAQTPQSSDLPVLRALLLNLHSR